MNNGRVSFHFLDILSCFAVYFLHRWDCVPNSGSEWIHYPVCSTPSSHGRFISHKGQNLFTDLNYIFSMKIHVTVIGGNLWLCLCLVCMYDALVSVIISARRVIKKFCSSSSKTMPCPLSYSKILHFLCLTETNTGVYKV